ncbi:endonuclease/exonuclease/phosphatase family protein [Chitinophaga sp. Mgbs1]|uniref:Endonuclease/exonuclease/phosphatase family protein n=1 Tax=Chitinophaga solisilvae TaxID=1233460 RepID=A0A9Q5DBT7_9BACT|nr:endonuclease/exonuclease/phosphatase family protein [Chitinophaga solisilvae]
MKQLLLRAALPVMVTFSVSACSKVLDTGITSKKTAPAHTELQADNVRTTTFKVLQFNTWMDGKLDLVADEIAAREPDFVTFSETQDAANFHINMENKLRVRNLTYFGGPGRNTSVISKYPIKRYEQVYGSSFTRLIAVIDGREVAVYSGHLDYTHYACYYPRGYDPVNWSELSAPVTDSIRIHNMNMASTRDEEIAAFITAARKDIDSGRIVILGGDFNEPSHLDWTRATRNMFDHHGVIMPWTTTTSLANAGFDDTYRLLYPDEVNYPGFTWVYQSDWAPKADERDRIDYIFSSRDAGLSVTDGYIVGPKSSIVRHVLTPENTMDKFSEPVGTWPSDHKALMTVFSLKTTVTATISTNKKQYAKGETVSISFTNSSANTNAWIGIYQSGKTPGAQYADAWKYTNGAAAGTMTLTLPADKPAGNYYVACFKDNGYIETAARVTFKYGQ